MELARRAIKTFVTSFVSIVQGIAQAVAGQGDPVTLSLLDSGSRFLHHMETMDQASRLHWDPSRLHFEFELPKRELRYKELVLYISEQCLDDPTFSRLKLLKILFYADFESFGRYGTPITGVAYRKFPFGPAPVAFGRYEDEMLRDGLIRIVRKQVYEQMRQRVLPLQDPNFDLFSARDIAVVGEWIRFFWGKTSKEISRFSHGRPWKLAQDSELIPYEAVYISNEPVSFEDASRAKELAARYHWKL